MAEEQEGAKEQTFLERKNIEVSFKRYCIDALGAMAQGLFASLLIGTIFGTLGDLTGIEAIGEIGGYAKAVAGPAMAIAIGYALQAPPLVLFSLAAVGQAANAAGGAGGPLAVLVIAIVAAELGKAVSKETRVDILVTPGVTVGIGCALAMLVAPWIGAAASSVGGLIMWATELQPFLMGIIVSVVVGIALTLPISSAAICAALSLTGLAGGAALAGCCAQMVGFAAASYRENGVGGLVSQGLGTSMLQMGNIMRKPVVTVPPSRAAWAPAAWSVPSACMRAGSPMASRRAPSSGWACCWCASYFRRSSAGSPRRPCVAPASSRTATSSSTSAVDNSPRRSFVNFLTRSGAPSQQRRGAVV